MGLYRKLWIKIHNIFYIIKYYGLYKKHIRIRDNCFCYIDKSAKVKVDYKLRFNQPLNDYFAYKNPYRGHLFIGRDASLLVENVSFISGTRLTIEDGAKFSWISGYINMNSTIVCSHEIKIGNDVIIGEKTHIQDSNCHHIERDGYKLSAPIIIEDHVWIGCHCIILPGVTIGTGSMIAAGSVVTHSIPPKSLAAGNPAKVVKENIKWHW